MVNNKLHPIKRAANLSIAEFEQSHLQQKQPIIISNTLDWPALGKWDPDYFKKVYPDKQVDLTIFRPEINMPGEEIRLGLSQAVDLMCNNRDERKKYYLMQRSLHGEFPELLADIGIPKYANKNHDHTINLWFGQAGTLSRAHYDYSNNFLAQILGRKRIRLFAPEDNSYLYPFSAMDTVVMNDVHHPAIHASRISDIDALNQDQFPNFKYATLYEGILYPGDLLYIPAGWWHEIKSFEVAISLNFWWKIKMEDFPRKQLTDVIGSYFCWYGDSFHEKVRLAFDLTQYHDDLEVAEFCLLNHFKCLTAYFLLSYLREKDITAHDWIKYLEVAKEFNESLLDPQELRNIIENVKLRTVDISLA